MNKYLFPTIVKHAASFKCTNWQQVAVLPPVNTGNRCAARGMAQFPGLHLIGL
jgi:hypothetical protein